MCAAILSSISRLDFGFSMSKKHFQKTTICDILTLWSHFIFVNREMILTTILAEDCFYLWAKADRESASWHPLILHSLDTLAVAENLWDKILSPGEKSIIAAMLGMDEERARVWTCFFASLHDIGKISPPFQFLDAAPDTIKAILKNLGLRKLPAEKYHHGEATAAILSTLLPSLLNNPIPVTKITGIFLKDLSRALGGHHGNFPPKKMVSKTGKYMKTSPNSDTWSELQQRFLQAIMEALILDPHELAETLAAKDDYDPSALVLFSGFVSVADWIASNEKFFPFCTNRALLFDKYLARARTQARAALDTIGWSGWRAPGNQLPFGKLFPDIGAEANPRPIQEWALATPQDLRFAVIESPMGEGKTEAALILLERLIVANELRGGYFALPTMATSNQMFGRVDTFLESWSSGTRVNLHLLHGKAIFSDAYQALQPRAVAQDGSNGNIVADEWFRRPKRGLLSPFAVGTVDQALMANLKTRHFFVRLFGLAGKVLIFDEVHAYDTYMLTLFENLLTWLSRLGTRVIILSATLPAATRERLFQSYAGDPGLSLPKASYPRITWIGANNTLQSAMFPSALSPTYHLAWRNTDIPDRASELAELLRNGGKVLWMCNTVSKAQSVYEELKDRLAPEGLEVSLFHARFPLGQRYEIEKRTLKTFGKDPKYPKQARVLVATQVVEQSLDLDFDLMISELAPIDLVLQRLGRLHRHKRPRPEKLKDPLLFLLVPERDENGLPCLKRSVYDEYILLRSWWKLSKTDSISLPQDMDGLIESVYGEEDRSGMDNLFRDKLDEAIVRSEKQKTNRTMKGKKVIIPRPGKRDTLNPLEVPLDESDPDTHTILQARTRLSDPSVDIVCLHRVNGRTCLDTGGTCPVDCGKTPETREDILALLENSVSLSFRGILKLFPGELVPKAWKRSSLLRHHRLVIFEENRYETAKGEMTLFLDRKKGLVSQWKGAKKDGSDLQSDQ